MTESSPVAFVPKVVAALAASLIVACSHSADEREIDRTRIVASRTKRPPTPLPSAQRFGLDRSPAAATNVPPSFSYALPPGWKRLPLRQFRDINLQIGDQADAQCWVSVLMGDAGGLDNNIARWRRQIGLGPTTHAEIEKLPRLKLDGLSGREALFVELDGSYAGMGKAGIQDAKFLGLIVRHGNWSVFVKAVGPKATITKERESFIALAKSLKPIRRGVSQGGAAKAASRPSDAGLAWDVPKGWRMGPKKRMRLVTFLPGTDDKTQVYLMLSGGALVDNVNRWRGQVGKNPVSKSAVDSYEKVRVAGRNGVLVEVTGEFKGGMGMAAIPDAGLTGIIVPGRSQSLFLKMIGPREVVQANRAKFLVFSKSIRVSK